MNSLSDDDKIEHVTTLNVTGAELVKIISKVSADYGFTFDGKPYTDALAEKNFPLFRSGYGDFHPVPNIVPGFLVWAGDHWVGDSGNLLNVGDDVKWIDFRSASS